VTTITYHYNRKKNKDVNHVTKYSYFILGKMKY